MMKAAWFGVVAVFLVAQCFAMPDEAMMQKSEEAGTPPSPAIAALNNIFAPPKRVQFTGAANKISPVDTRCVMCQYFVQRIENEIMQYSAPAVFSETESKIKDQLKVAASKNKHKTEKKAVKHSTATEFVEVESKVEQVPPPPLDLVEGRNREADVRSSVPITQRYSRVRSASPTLADQQERTQYKQMFQAVYQDFQSLCVNRMPQPFVQHCQAVMTDYDQVAEGLHYGDRPDAICMTLNYCGALSYAYNQPHARYVDEHPADAPSVPDMQTV